MARNKENLAAAVQAAQEEISSQFTTASGLEAKLLGLAGALVAIGGVMVTVKAGLSDDNGFWCSVQAPVSPSSSLGLHLSAR